MYRFYTYYKYIVIIVIYSDLKIQKWFSREQCAVINMNEYWNAAPLRAKIQYSSCMCF